MKYQQEIIIKRSRNEVVNKFSDPDNMEHWQRGFVFMKPINGELGAEGSQNLLKYDMGKRVVEMTETILKNDLPQEFSATYEAKGVYNFQVNKFEETSENHTLWITFNEFKFNGFMKFIGWFMPGAFKKQSYKFMQDFKAFVEDGKSVMNE